MEPEDVKESDYGTDVAQVDSHAVGTHFDPHTGARLKRPVRIALIVLGVLFLVVCLDRYLKARSIARETAAAAAAPPAVDVVAARPVGAVQPLLLPGQTAAWHTTTIYARVNGYVATWYVDIGDKVKAGQLLALLETPELDAQLAAARAQLEAAQAQVQVRRAETELSSTTYDRWRDSPQGVVSEQEREEKRADYHSASARLNAAQAEVALDRARVNQYAALAQFKRVIAPYDGVITNRDIDIGNLVTAGSGVNTTPLFVMTQNDPIRIFVDVPQSAAADLMDGKTQVSVQSNDGVARAATGTVTRTSQAINQQARTLRAEVDIANPGGQFVPGLYVKVTFALPPRGLVQVPAAALLFRAAGPQVALVDAGGRLTFRNVTIARDDGSVVELASGVAPGEQLALNVSSQISEGERVSAHPLDSSGPAALATAHRQR
ncbi:MAG TPA: efflux RND transporter periplasmic adaptor subunit [Steroidobacteraceae bacterium]|nr:efflux RND transporter periplasmic adaptor subunit [Steroidobacteraceae bacterium]